jgi:peptide/nickel transport system permease protein
MLGRAMGGGAERRGILRWLIGRLGAALLTVWASATVAFLAMRAIPGDPVDVMLGPLSSTSAEQREMIRTDFGLDLPMWRQYFDTMSGLVVGDLGTSYQQKLPVVDVIGRQLVPTLQLTALALMIAALFVVLGQLVARSGSRRGRFRAAAVTSFEVTAVTMPSFWLGFLLLTVFSFGLGWFPPGGSQGFASLVLPAIAIAIPVAGILGQLVSGELDAAERSGYALTARAGGAGRCELVTRHGLRHAVPAVAAITGTIVGGVLGGAVLVERVFSRPGLGQVTLTAIVNRDLPVIFGLVVLSACLFAAIGIAVDAVVTWADPRPTSRLAVVQ